MPRRLPPPWQIEQIPGGYVVKDANGQHLAYVAVRAELVPTRCTSSPWTRLSGLQPTSQGSQRRSSLAGLHQLWSCVPDPVPIVTQVLVAAGNGSPEDA